MKKNLLFLVLSLALVDCLMLDAASAQPAIQWQKYFGGSNWDKPFSIKQSSDGGFIVAGYTDSNDSNVSVNHGLTDMWIIKIDSVGNLLWEKSLGGTGYDEAYSIFINQSGNILVAGVSTSNDGDVSGNHGLGDGWVISLDNQGNVIWKKCFGGTQNDFINKIRQTIDGGYVIAGSTTSNDGDVSGNHSAGFDDCWIIKLDNIGNIQWQKCLGGTLTDHGYSIVQTPDSGYVLAGRVYSNDGDVSGNHSADTVDCWIVKLNKTGVIQWQKCVGGTGTDYIQDIVQTFDYGYVACGVTNSTNGDMSINHGDFDLNIFKLDSAGNLVWQKSLGGTDYETGFSLQQTNDYGFIVSGLTRSSNGDVVGYNGGDDSWILKLDSVGNVIWQLCLQDSLPQWGMSVIETNDGGYALASKSFTNFPVVNGNHGIYDYWIVKLAPYVGIEEENGKPLSSFFPNPFTTHATIKFPGALHSATFRLYNLYGQLVQEKNNINGESFGLNRETLGSGVYVYEVTEKEKKICSGKAVVY